MHFRLRCWLHVALVVVLQLLLQELLCKTPNNAHESALLTPATLELIQDHLHEFLHLGAGVLPEEIKQRRPQFPHVDVLLPRLLLEDFYQRWQRKRAVLGMPLPAEFRFLLLLMVAPVVVVVVAQREVDPSGFEGTLHCLLQELFEAEARTRSFLFSLKALADLLLGLVDKASAVARI